VPKEAAEAGANETAGVVAEEASETEEGLRVYARVCWGLSPGKRRRLC
jgi:hypothetical protein